MKKINKILCVGMAISFICSGCGSSDSVRNVSNNNSVDAVIQNEIGKSTQEKKTSVETQTSSEKMLAQDEVMEGQETWVDSNVDIDISVMSSDMTYATVYQLMSEADKYVGKTVKIKGKHYSSFFESTGLTYHYALIQDATACCAQGLEFELAEGLEYPDEDTEVIVVGTFDTYAEDGYLYCTLRNAIVQ